MILKSAVSLPPISKSMTIMTIPCISHDSGAIRPLPAHFQDSLALVRLSLKPFVFRTCVVQGVVQWVVRGLCGRFWLHGDLSEISIKWVTKQNH